MKNITLKLFVVLAGVFSVAGAFAESHALIANVPFAFSVGDKVLPAGRYQVMEIDQQGAIMVRNIDHPEYAALAIGSEDSGQVLPNRVNTQGRLVFDSDHGQYVLREARGPLNAVVRSSR